eukprot:363552-Chlamydomonas_euryale.AAC.5
MCGNVWVARLGVQGRRWLEVLCGVQRCGRGVGSCGRRVEVRLAAWLSGSLVCPAASRRIGGVVCERHVQTCAGEGEGWQARSGCSRLDISRRRVQPQLDIKRGQMQSAGQKTASRAAAAGHKKGSDSAAAGHKRRGCVGLVDGLIDW